MATETGRLVLVVDDDDGIRELLSLLIQNAGYRVATAEDGVVAEDRIRALKPDLIVLDLMLPRHGGFELLRSLQGTEFARVPIIVVTGRYTDRRTTDMIRQESNVVELLEKPLKTPRFLQALHRALGSTLTPDEAREI